MGAQFFDQTSRQRQRAPLAAFGRLVAHLGADLFGAFENGELAGVQIDVFRAQRGDFPAAGGGRRSSGFVIRLAADWPMIGLIELICSRRRRDAASTFEL